MHAWVRRALCAVGITGGIVLLGMGLAEAASADGNNGPVTSGQNGIVSGNQTGVDANAPINLSGNQVTVLGNDNQSSATGSAATTAAPPGPGAATTTGQGGIGSGNQTAVGVNAPVNVSGNQVTVIGHDNHAGSVGGSSTGASPGSGAAAGSPKTSGQDGIASGNQTAVGIQLPVNASGNQVTVLGADNVVHSAAASSTGTGAGAAGAAPTTTGQGGLIAGNQTGIGLNLPINLSGNQITVIGDHNALVSGGGSTTPGPSGGSATGGATTGGATTSGQDGIGSGNQTGVSVLAPIAATGNQATVIGNGNTVTSTGGSTTGGSTGGGATGPGATTSGQDGIGSGNQTGVSVLAPVAATGNQATVIGNGNTVTSTGGSTTGGGASGPGQTTTGAGGIGSGNQTPVVVQVPVDVSGNQVTVVGDGNTVTSTGGSTTGGTTPGTPGTPTGGGVVSPPASGGGAPGGPQGSAGPGDTLLPNTGMSGDLLGLGVLGLLLLSAGLVLVRPRRLTVR
ncbi:hypothetical protein ACVW00_001438 [Marmoricola sp. URHA0025 HA25]